MPDAPAEYLTTRELAELLRIKERKVYELAASGVVPCSRATGKLLFPRRGVEDWVRQNSSGSATGSRAQRPPVFLGSYDPLLEWALRESHCDLATFLDGSLDGLDRFARHEGVASGLHLWNPDDDDWNRAQIEARFGSEPVVLIEFAWRERGLVVAAGRESELSSVAHLRGLRVVPRQAEAGSQTLLRQLLQRAGLAETDLTWADTARTETEAALVVSEGNADAALGLAGLAHQCRLGFVPLMRERFDLLVDRRAWFETPFQQFLAFCRSPEFERKARALRGYDVGQFGRVVFNGL